MSTNTSEMYEEYISQSSADTFECEYACYDEEWTDYTEHFDAIAYPPDEDE